MARNASDCLVERLCDWGVTRIFGYPGDGVNGVMEALSRAKERVDFVQTRHEEEAAFMAAAHAKWTGRPGVCVATSGPGAIHLLNGLYDARMDHQPVVAIVGQQASFALGGDFQQEVHLTSLFKDVASHYVQQACRPSQVRMLVDRALRIAVAERTVTCIAFPNDVQEMPAEDPPRKHGSSFTGVGYSFPEIVPAEADLRRAADVLNAGKRVAMLVGAGALHATDEVVRAAEILGAGVAKALLGKAAVPDDVPFCLGGIGLLGTKPSWDMMMTCDTLFIVGSGFPYSEFLPKEKDARGVQIDVSARMLSLRFPAEAALHGDSALTLRRLLPLLERKADRDWQGSLVRGMTEWREVMDARAHRTAHPVNPQLLFWEASKRLPARCILTADSGSAANWYARDLSIRRGMMGSLSGNLATMCPGVPYAAAAKFAFPDRVAIAFVGDGAMQMLGNAALVTIAKYWRRWSDPRLVVLVLANRDLNQVTWEQRVFNGDAKFAGSQDVPAFPYARYAELLGLKGIAVERPEQVGPAWDQALAADRPAVIDARCDPDVATLPPHISLEQARHFLSSLVKGDPDVKGIIEQTAKQMMGRHFR